MFNLQLYKKYKTVKTSKFSCFEKLKIVIFQHFCLTNYLNDFSNIKTQMIHFLSIDKLTNYSPSCTRLVEFTASEQFRVRHVCHRYQKLYNTNFLAYPSQRPNPEQTSSRCPSVLDSFFFFSIPSNDRAKKGKTKCVFKQRYHHMRNDKRLFFKSVWLKTCRLMLTMLEPGENPPPFPFYTIIAPPTGGSDN